MKVKDFIKVLQDCNQEATLEISDASSGFPDETADVGGLIVSQNDDDVAGVYAIITESEHKEIFEKDEV